MNNIDQIKAQRFQESENKRYNMQMRKLRAEHDKSYKKEVDKNKTHMEQLKSENIAKIELLETELEKKLIEQREKHSRLLNMEKKRLDQELVTLKASHEGKVSELRMSNQGEIDELVEYHQKTLDNARQKYMKEKAKWDAKEA
jgi:hypothetical protein